MTISAKSFIVILISAFFYMILTFCYRNSFLTRLSYKAAMFGTSAVIIYIGLVWVGMPYNNIVPIILALLGGVSIGLAGSMQIIRLTESEYGQD